MPLSTWTVLGLVPINRHQEAVNPNMAHAQLWGYERQHLFSRSSRGSPEIKEHCGYRPNP